VDFCSGLMRAWLSSLQGKGTGKRTKEEGSSSWWIFLKDSTGAKVQTQESGGAQKEPLPIYSGPKLLTKGQKEEALSVGTASAWKMYLTETLLCLPDHSKTFRILDPWPTLLFPGPCHFLSNQGHRGHLLGKSRRKKSPIGLLSFNSLHPSSDF
jgi:hypothetical protein